ncbi:hypothetical protein D3C85_1753150 [compost metagenome]
MNCNRVTLDFIDHKLIHDAHAIRGWSDLWKRWRCNRLMGRIDAHISFNGCCGGLWSLRDVLGGKTCARSLKPVECG